MEDVMRSLTSTVGRATGRAWRALAGIRNARSATASISVAAEPDVALLASAAALRRLGLRITRYELADGVVEALDAARETLVQIHASAAPEPGRAAAPAALTTMRLVGTGREARTLLRAFRTELARSTPDSTEPHR